MTTRPIDRLLAVMARLRDRENGCPWDLEQSFATIAPYTIEEAYEVADAIERDDMAALKDELGDLLLQVVFHARMAEEAGHFGFEDVATAIAEKMERRHPHVFGDTVIGSAEAQSEAWEAHKAAEREAAGGAASALDGVALALPALLRAAKISRRATRIGFDWPDAQAVVPKIAEEIAEIEAELAALPGRQRWRRKSAICSSPQQTSPASSASNPRPRYAAPPRNSSAVSAPLRCWRNSAASAVISTRWRRCGSR